MTIIRSSSGLVATGDAGLPVRIPSGSTADDCDCCGSTSDPYVEGSICGCVGGVPRYVAVSISGVTICGDFPDINGSYVLENTEDHVIQLGYCVWFYEVSATCYIIAYSIHNDPDCFTVLVSDSMSLGGKIAFLSQECEPTANDCSDMYRTHSNWLTSPCTTEYRGYGGTATVSEYTV